jgi:hypothetical protein
MKKLLIALLLCCALTGMSQVAVNTTGAAPDGSAQLDVSSNVKGLLLPRMTALERGNIPTPAPGLLVYQTDGIAGFYYNNGTAAVPDWVVLVSPRTGGATQWTTTGSNLSYSAGNVTTASLGVGIDPLASTRLRIRGLTGSSSTSNALQIENSLGNSLFTVVDNGGAILGGGTALYKLNVGGNIGIPSTNTYRYNTAKTKKYKVAAQEMQSINSSVYDRRIDDGFSSPTISGLNSMWATNGTPGTVAYFTAVLHLPDSAVITGLAAQLVKNGGSLQSLVEIWRSDGTGYLANTAQLIASCTTISSGGGIAYVAAPTVNAAYNVIDNANYAYFIRWSGEQNTQNLRFVNATVTYQIYRSEF